MKRAVYTLWKAEGDEWDEPKIRVPGKTALYGAVELKSDIIAEMFYRIVKANLTILQEKLYNRITARVVSSGGVCLTITIEPKNAGEYLRQYKLAQEKCVETIPF